MKLVKALREHECPTAEAELMEAAADEIDHLRQGLKDIRAEVSKSLDPKIWHMVTEVLGDAQELWRREQALRDLAREDGELL